MKTIDITGEVILTPGIINYFIKYKKEKGYKNPKELVFLYVKNNKYLFNNVENIKIFEDILQDVIFTKQCLKNLINCNNLKIFNFLNDIDIKIDINDIFYNISDILLNITLHKENPKFLFLLKFKTEILIEHMSNKEKWENYYTSYATFYNEFINIFIN